MKNHYMDLQNVTQLFWKRMWNGSQQTNYSNLFTTFLYTLPMIIKLIIEKNYFCGVEKMMSKIMKI